MRVSQSSSIMSAQPTAAPRDPFRLFLSGSTADFESVRLSLKQALERGQLHIIHQADFPQTQADTVLKLAQLIAPCGVLVHLIGRQPGSIAAPAAVAEYLAYAEREGGFLHRLPELRLALGDCSGLTYTQWEVFIALHLGMDVFVYGDPTQAQADHPQRQHIDRLRSARRYTDSFTDAHDLKDKIWAALLWHYRQAVPSAQLPEIFRPSNLPGGYIGRLFLGRDDFLSRLRDSLQKQTHATAITQAPAATGISGLGGIGKTHAAVEYAHRHRGDYTALLFVSGDSPEKLSASLAALCGVLYLDAAGDLPPDESARVSIAVDWLATHRGWLLIADNVDTEESAAALTGLLERLTTGHVLITSRLHDWADNFESLDLSVLSPDAATDLLLQLTDKQRRKTPDDPAQARLLADLLEGLPLALHQAAGYIKEQRLTLADYLALYEQEAADLLGWFKKHLIPYAGPEELGPRPVLITWKTSFEKLDPDTRFWLLVFAHFASDPIPEFLLDSAPDAAEEVKTRHRAAKRALAQAETYSLLNRDPDQPRFKLHRLVQHILRLSASEADRATALAMGIQLFEENDPGDPQDVRTWKQWNPLQPHAVSIVNHAPEEPAPQHLSWLLGCLALLLNTKSLHAQAELHSRRALKLEEASFGPDHPNVAISLNNLAQLFQATNRLAEAEPLLRRVVDILQNKGGDPFPNYAGALNNLAHLLQDTNRLTVAESLLRRALGIDEACYGPDHPNVARHLNNLSELLRVTNRLAEAEPLMRRALGIDEASYAPDHPKVAIRLNNLALLLQATNRLAEAEPLMRRVLEIFEISYGKDNPNVATSLNNLAQLLQATNRLAEAEPLMQRALGIDEASYGPDHPDVAIDLNNLARLLQDTNRLDEAEQLMRRTLSIDEASYGPDHPDVARDLNNLAQLFKATNRLSEAEPLMRRVVLIFAQFTTRTGHEHPHLQAACMNYQGLMEATGLTEAQARDGVLSALRDGGLEMQV
jgi:tetratricopeptide (TPR) repeat protein